jgi:hypothetical protein
LSATIGLGSIVKHHCKWRATLFDLLLPYTNDRIGFYIPAHSTKVEVAASHHMRTIDGNIHPPPSQIKHQQQAKHSKRSFQLLQQQQATM